MFERTWISLILILFCCNLFFGASQGQPILLLNTKDAIGLGNWTKMVSKLIATDPITLCLGAIDQAGDLSLFSIPVNALGAIGNVDYKILWPGSNTAPFLDISAIQTTGSCKWSALRSDGVYGLGPDLGGPRAAPAEATKILSVNTDLEGNTFDTFFITQTGDIVSTNSSVNLSGFFSFSGHLSDSDQNSAFLAVGKGFSAAVSYLHTNIVYPVASTMKIGINPTAVSWGYDEFMICAHDTSGSVWCETKTTNDTPLQGTPSFLYSSPTLSILNDSLVTLSVIGQNLTETTSHLAVLSRDAVLLGKIDNLSNTNVLLVTHGSINDLIVMAWCDDVKTVIQVMKYDPSFVPASGPVISGTPSTSPVATTSPADNIPLASANPTADEDRSRARVLGPAISIPLAAAALGVFLLVFLLNKRKKQQRQKQQNGSDRNNGNTIYGSMIPLAEKDFESINPTAIKPSEIDKRLQIPYKSLVFEREIGAGSYGKVFLGEWRGAKVAIKVNNAITDIEGFIAEAKLTLGIAPHPNLVQTFGVSLDGPNPCIVLEFCGGGSLDNLIFDSDKPITDQQQRDFALKIAYGLLHLHNNNIVHRDLAARNILLTADGQPKISDFGMSRVVHDEAAKYKTKTAFGPIRWMAPECLRDQSYSTKSDVWSYGVIVYELVAGMEPHVNEDQLAIAVKIRDTNYTPTIPAESDPVLKHVMEMCWRPNANDRPTMEEIANYIRSQ